MKLELDSDERLLLVAGLYRELDVRRKEHHSDHSKESNEIFNLIQKICPVSPTS